MSALRQRPSSSGEKGPHLLEYLRVLYWRRWLAMSVFAVVVAAGAIYTWTATPTYEARASVLIESDPPNVVSFKDVLDEGINRGGYYETQQELLKSRALAERTVAAMRLWTRPGFPAHTEQEAVSAVLSGLQVQPLRGSRVITVKFRATDPALAADIVNSHVREYIRQSVENHFNASKEATDWLDAQLAKERHRVEQAESALQVYREQHDAVSLKAGQDIVVQKLSDLNASVTKAKTARIDKEVQYRELAAIRNDRAALASSPIVLSNPFIQQLKGDLSRLQREYAQLAESLGDRHPTLIEKRTEVENVEQRLDAEIAKVVRSVNDTFQAAQSEEATLLRALDDQKREALSLNRTGIQYAALEREAESVRLVYQNLLQRAKETSVSRELQVTNIRAIDNALVPRQPITPNTQLNMAASVVAGMLLAMVTVFVVELFDDRLRTPIDVKAQLGLTCLGLLPESKGADKQGPSLIGDGVDPAFVEAVRAMRTAVVSGFDPRSRHSILVASATQGEGKSTVAMNLAAVLASSRERVLLIDGDLRQPSIHQLVGQRLEPGLASVLAGSASLSDVLSPTKLPGLMVASAGTATAGAPELLESPAFAELVDVMEEHFAWVVIDSPPVLSVTDAKVLALRAGAVLFVIGSAMTSAQAASVALSELRHSGGAVIGAVLNRVNLRHHPFYFAPYQRASYPYGPGATAAGGAGKTVGVTA
jgi:capsular exopolysaccharide synthesis family protein